MNSLIAPNVGTPLTRFLFTAGRSTQALRHVVGKLSPDQRTSLLIATAAAVLSGWNLLNAPEYQDDEGTYTAQALAVLEGKMAPYTYWYDHPPVAWVQLAALSWIPLLLGQGDQTYVGQMRYVVAVFFVASTVLVYLLARRLELQRVFAVLAAGLFCLSPLSLVLGRQVFIDNVGLPWLLLAFYLMLSPRLKLWHHIGAGACFALAVLSKETLAIFGPALLVALLHRPYWKTRFFSLVGFLSVGGLILAFFPLLAVLRNELFAGPGHVSLQDALTYQFVSRPGSGSLFDPDSSRQELVMGWMYYDKYVVIAGMVAALVCLLRREARWITSALCLFSAPVVIGQGYMPAMYVIAAIPFLVLAMAVAADLTWRCVALLFPAVPYPGRHSGGVRLVGLGTRMAALGLTCGAMLAVITVLLLPQWIAMNRTLLQTNSNRDWQHALEWSKKNLPRDDTALVPYSMWQDLNADGRHDPWKVIALEKMDLDSEFETHHPDGWRAIDWIIEGPPTARNIENLQLHSAGQALRNSRIVVSFGQWHVREVIEEPPAVWPQAESASSGAAR
ncbi:glycosyltransferase family 39 protein [Pseudarthrobacter sp. NamB4]|uniref:ArnT family glycosyltransferase n=1 Tax=Pseudarthrobacter sp. NamB4 TaxID=2576837 RepID=UPI0010FCE1B4|nr:glycosyltransferase family 39 protein [Pseudarthrobacter sp. NamB4]TLM74553.1 glycosyltransferase family 39 protein [Pseudarthrobacter sp. NamB4]